MASAESNFVAEDKTEASESTSLLKPEDRYDGEVTNPSKTESVLKVDDGQSQNEQNILISVKSDEKGTNTSVVYGLSRDSQSGIGLSDMMSETNLDATADGDVDNGQSQSDQNEQITSFSGNNDELSGGKMSLGTKKSNKGKGSISAPSKMKHLCHIGWNKDTSTEDQLEHYEAVIKTFNKPIKKKPASQKCLKVAKSISEESEVELKYKMDIRQETGNKWYYVAQRARDCTIMHETGIVLHNGDSNTVAQLIAPRKMTEEHHVFSIEILKAGEHGRIGIGLVPKNYDVDTMPGDKDNSLGYITSMNDCHVSADGKRLASKEIIFTNGDVLSFKIDMDNKKGYFSRNDLIFKELDNTLKWQDLYPCIAITSTGSAVQILQENLWTSDVDENNVTPEPLITDKLDHLWISPAKKVTMTELDNGFFGWLLFYNPSKRPVAVKVTYGRKQNQSYEGVLNSGQAWIEHLELGRGLCLHLLEHEQPKSGQPFFYSE